MAEPMGILAFNHDVLSNAISRLTILLLPLITLLTATSSVAASSSQDEELKAVLVWVYEQIPEVERQELLDAEALVYVVKMTGGDPMIYDFQSKTLTKTDLTLNEFTQQWGFSDDLKSTPARRQIFKFHRTETESQVRYNVDVGLSYCYGSHGNVFLSTDTGAVEQKSRLIVKCCF